jgi:hypothetical protein
VLVAHTCNPSHSGGRDQEDHGSKPAQRNSSSDPILEKNPSQKRAGRVAQVKECLPSKREALSSNPLQKKKKVFAIINNKAKFILILVNNKAQL